MSGGVVVRRESDTLFVASSEGRQVGRCAVAIGGDTWEFYSTVVEPAFEGRGIASALVRQALEAAEEAGARVISSCWYVDGWLDRHPEFQHLRDARRGAPVGSPEDPACRIAPAVLGE